MSSTITRGELIAQLASRWGDDNPNPFPFVFENQGVSADFKYNVDTSYLNFTCCGDKSHVHVKTPKQIIKMVEDNNRVPCEKCRINGVGDGDDDLLPGETAFGTFMTDKEKAEVQRELGIEAKQEEKIEEETEEEAQEADTDELNEEIQAQLDKMKNDLGYAPFIESSVELANDEMVFATCKLCGVNSAIEIGKFNQVLLIDKKNNIRISSCPVCQSSIKDDHKRNETAINYALLDHIEEVINKSLPDHVFSSENDFGSFIDPVNDEIILELKDESDPTKYKISIDSLLNITKRYDILELEEIDLDESNEEDEVITEEINNNEEVDEDESIYDEDADQEETPEIDEDETIDPDDGIYDECDEEDTDPNCDDDVIDEDDNDESDEDLFNPDEEEIDEDDDEQDYRDVSKQAEKLINHSENKVGVESVIEVDGLEFEVVDGDTPSVSNPFENLFSRKVEVVEETKPPIKEKNFFNSLKEGIKRSQKVKEEERVDESDSKEVIEVDGLEFEVGDNRLGKSFPVDRERKGAVRSDSKQFRDPHQQDPLQRLVDEKNDELKHKWYNTRVYAASEYEDMYFNELGDEENLVEEFFNSPTGKLITKVRELTEVEIMLSLNDETFQLPIVDFSTGVRAICLRVDDESQMKTPLHQLINYPFQFDLRDKKEGIRKVFIYSDSVDSSDKKFKATLKSLVKIVGRDTFDPRRIVNIGDNYMLFYVTDKKIIDDFELENSTYPMGKPCNKSIAIIAMKTDSFNKKLKPKDIISILSKDNFDMRKYNLYMVASARYIENLNTKTGIVEYRITDYLEMTSSIILDGFEHIVGAILKEHAETHLGLNYNFTYEFDPSLMSSPSLERYYDNSEMMPIGEHGNQFCYVRKHNYRRSVEDTYRQDSKLFTTRTLGVRFRDDIKVSPYNITIESQKNRFIESMGFEKVYQPSPKVFMLSPIFTTKLSIKPSIFTLSKIDLSVFFQGSGIYSGGYDNLLIQRMLLQQMNN